MHTSRFQLGLLCALSLSLGAALTSGEAIGYPTGSVVSFQQNPVVSIGGTAYAGEAAKPLMTAPAGQALVITDVVLTSTSSITCKRAHKSELSSSSGAVLSQYETTSDVARAIVGNNWGAASPGRDIQHAYQSGLRIQAGETLYLGVTETDAHSMGSCDPSITHGVRYSISGYHAEP